MDADANGDRDRPDRSIDRRTILVGTAAAGLAAIHRQRAGRVE